MTNAEIIGFVDNVMEDRVTISGWVGALEDGSLPTVEALSGSQIVGSVTFGAERQDVTRATGRGNLSFVIKLLQPVKAIEFLGGSFQVVAKSNSTQTMLRLSNGARATETKSALIDLARQVTDPVEIITNLDRNLDTEKEYAAEALRAGAAGVLSPLPFPVGLRSRDHSAQLGHRGHLFLTGGSNELHSRYATPQTDKDRAKLEDDAATWASVARDRFKRITSRGIGFTQIIIPEKLTVLRHLAPVQVSGPTPLLTCIEEKMRSEPFWVSGLDIFEGWDSPIDPWQRNDAHCSPAGTLAIVRALIKNMPGCEAPFLDHVPLTKSVYRDGELTDRFFGTPIWDEHLEPAPDVLAASSDSIENILAVNPTKGVMGTHMVWRNPKAPIQKKVVVFGNSYFGSSATEPAKLGWWFARMFAEYHLVWKAEVDHAYIAEAQPDYVIAQSIERFLGRIPAA